MNKTIKYLSAFAIILTTGACGGLQSKSQNQSLTSESPEASRVQRYETTIHKINVKPTNAGINPDFFAYIIRGQALLGSNQCFARGKSAALVSQQIGNKIYVKTIITAPVSHSRVTCTMQYDPVYAPVEIRVQGQHSLVKDVILINVDQQGRHINVKDLRAP